MARSYGWETMGASSYVSEGLMHLEATQKHMSATTSNDLSAQDNLMRRLHIKPDRRLLYIQFLSVHSFH